MSREVDKYQQAGLAVFMDVINSADAWNICKEEAGVADNHLGVFIPEHGVIYRPVSEQINVFKNNTFLEVVDTKGNEIGLFDSYTRLLWRLYNDKQAMLGTKSYANKWNKELDCLPIKSWELPLRADLKTFAVNPTNPLLNKDKTGLIAENEQYFSRWPTAEGELFNIKFSEVLDIATALVAALFGSPHKQEEWEEWERKLKERKLEEEHNNCAYIVSYAWQGRPYEDIVQDMISKGLSIVEPDTNKVMLDDKWKNLSQEQIFMQLFEQKIQLQAVDNESLVFDAASYKSDRHFKNLDYTPCRLPKLNQTQLTDPAKGLWELFGQTAEELKEQGSVARDPWQDVQNRAVAIDFGTSSTVVGITNQHGGQELLRIGVRDFYQPTQARHFENPTVLEFLDFKSFTQAWNEQAYRPELDWDWVRAAHEAQASFRDNSGDTDILASILPRLKQWALRSDVDRRIKLTGRKGQEMELAPHTERNPVRGQPIQVGAEDPLDPIELYAWYLGMTINWRERGIFLKYYLSFPVKYPLNVRNRILASFRRGLQRSLPQSLITHYPHVLNDFEVNELASEPAAYAAAALPFLNVEPTEEGVPYAVFDFGGGTSDFDFGVLRWANKDEEAEGFERVFEHVGSGGDNFLGAENLLEHLAYETFRMNEDVLRKEKIQFTLPMDALAFAGSELLLASTQAAQTNVIMLTAKLRDFMEGESAELASQISLDLLDVNGEKQRCELMLDADYLNSFLAERIERGVQAFFIQLAGVVDQLPPLPIHILMAGNGSRSRHMQALLSNENNQLTDILAEIFGSNSPEVKIHPPLPVNEQNPHAPTSKTGVALGLLKLTPGWGVLMKNEARDSQAGQAPFGWYAGRLYRGSFAPELEPDTDYGQWHSLGVINGGVFNLYVTKSPRAKLGLADGSPELKLTQLSVPDAPPRAKLFVRATTPGCIEYTHAIDESDLDGAVVYPFNLEQL